MASITLCDRTKSSDTWRAYQNEFKKIIGLEPSIELLLQIDEFPFAHEAAVFIPETRELFITSNQFKDGDDQTTVQISKVSLEGVNNAATLEKINCEMIHMANGGVNYQDGILFCAQGSKTQPSGLFKTKAAYPYDTEAVLTSYLGRPFNAINDVVVHKDGSIWFTDPSYGYDQGYRSSPSLPNVVYRYDPTTTNIRAMADGLGRPNGICFSPDYSTVYVTDTDQVRGSSVDYSRAASM